MDESEVWTLRCWPIAEILRRTGYLSATTVRRWCYEDKVRYYKHGKVYYVNLDDALKLARPLARRKMEHQAYVEAKRAEARLTLNLRP